ncbi:glycoside hydrolase superfamily [Mycena pura]|uniref:Glycoside hydrolase superfamily n=1 Tax=Mycena pura TaxID=153505 RepID=A0AAD6VUB6_9AGAR|nr:glycoside hydrolase superfamily [Mycena pura]
MWAPHPHFLLLVLSLVLQTVLAVKYVDVTPAVVRHRRRLGLKYENERKRKRDIEQQLERRTYDYPPADRQKLAPALRSNRFAAPDPPLPFSRKSSAYSNERLSALTAKHNKRQDQDISCNSITITPPGFDGSCAVGLPCPNGACCGASGFCGYGSEFCGTGCSSNCDAVAECGPNAAAGNELCPLNVCCDKFGFCGSTDDFCGANCIGDNCGEPSIPTGVNTPVTSRVIGYYEGWYVFGQTLMTYWRTLISRTRRASSRVCDAWFPQNIPASAYTHLYYSFASIDPDSFQVVPASSSDVPQYTEFTNLKQSNPNLKTYISVGGWAFNDPPTQQVFSNTAGSATNRQTFATSLVNFLIQYGFDGVDIDWEYPVACERGGSPGDKANFVLLMQTIRQTVSSGHSFGLTFTTPSSYWYLQHFDLLGLLQYADWTNLMSYDLHGVWDAKDVYIGSVVQAHTNLTEIEQSIQLFQRVGVPLDKITLGIGFYGRSFELSDPTCTTPGCHFSGPAPGGACTQADGILSFSEIEQILSQSTVQPVYDQAAQVKYLVYNDNDWISYDDAETLTAKVNFAKGAGLGGLMVWAVDLDNFKYVH